MNKLTQTICRAARGGLATVLVGLGALLPALPVQAQESWRDQPWLSLDHPPGRPAVGRPAWGRNLDGRMELFTIASDNALWHTFHGGPRHGWSEWEPLGGFITSNPAVGSNRDGRLEVFVRGGDNALYHQWQVAPNSRWSGWAGLGGPQFLGDPAVESNADGRLEVFVRATNNSIWHVWQVVPDGQWSGWECLCAGDAFGNPAVVRNRDGRLEVFYRGADHAGRLGLMHIAQTRPNGTWGALESLGHPEVFGTRMQGDPAVARNADGRLEVFVRGEDNHTYHRRQPNPGFGPWVDWLPLLGDLHGDPVSVINRGDGLEVFVRGFDDSLWHRWQTRSSSSNDYMPWTPLSGPGSPIQEIAVGLTADRRMEVFVRAADGRIYHKWER